MAFFIKSKLFIFIAQKIEDITWPRGDTILSSSAQSISHVWANKVNEWEDKIRIPKRPCNVLFSFLKNLFSKQQNSAIKEATYRKMTGTKMLWNSDIKL